MKRYCLALDLKDNPALIREYVRMHTEVWPEIKDSIWKSGILEMEIYLIRNRLFMIIETTDEFSFERKAELDLNDPKVMEWEKLMWKYQASIDPAQPAIKWQPMELIFKL